MTRGEGGGQKSQKPTCVILGCSLTMDLSRLIAQHIIARNEMEIIEQKFREMGLPITDENNDEKKEEDEIRFGSFEDLNEISVQEQQHSLPFRNDI